MSQFYHIFVSEEEYLSESQSFDGQHVVFVKSDSPTNGKRQRMRGFNNAVSHTANGHDYVQIEYIENTSNAFIDTQYIPKANCKIAMRIYSNGTAGDAYHGIYDSRGGGNSTGITFFPFNGIFALNWGTAVQNTTIPFSEHVLYDIEVSSGKLKVNGVETTFTAGTDFSNATSIKLFRNADASKRNWYGRIYSMKIYEGRTLVRNLVPVLKISTAQFGLYDKKTGVFFASSTSTQLTGVLALRSKNGYNYFYRYSNDKRTFTEPSTSFIDMTDSEMQCVDANYKRNMLYGASNIDTYSASITIKDRQNFVTTMWPDNALNAKEDQMYTGSIDLSFTNLADGTATSSKDAWFQSPVNSKWTSDYGTRIWNGWKLSNDTNASSKRGTFTIRAAGHATVTAGPKGIGETYSPQIRMDSLTGTFKWKNIKLCEGDSSVYTPAPEDATFGHMPGSYLGTCKTLKPYASYDIKDYKFN